MVASFCCVMALAWAAPVVLAAGPAVTFTNPVLDRNFPDPAVVRAANGTFFAFGTGDRIQVAASEDLVNWRYLGPALGPGTNTKWGDGRTFWAADVTRHSWGGETTYVMYYAGVQSNERLNKKKNHCIGVALSPTPQGPGTPLICRPSYIAIDPKRVDVGGKAHLFWGSGHGGAIFVSPLEPHSWRLLASPNLEPALTFMFDGCCRGDGASSSAEIGPLPASACADACVRNDTCTAIELDGCLNSTQCGKNCFHYFGTSGGTIVDGDCRLDGDMKCYQKAQAAEAPLPDRSSVQRALLGDGAADAAVVIQSNLQSEYEQTVEGAWVDFDAEAPGGAAWFIYYSGSNCCTDKALYGVSVARAPANSPTGPFTKKAPPTSGFGSAILASTFNGTEAGPWQAPGHNAIIRDDDGQAWMLYHAFRGSDRAAGRVLMLQKVEYRDGWPWVGKPAAGLQQAPKITTASLV